MKRLTSRVASRHLHAVEGVSPVDLDAYHDRAIARAGVALHHALEGTEIDAPGPVGDALRGLAEAVARSGR